MVRVLIKKLWITVDDPKIVQKEKMKAISLIMQCYNKRLDLLNLEPKINDLKEYIDVDQLFKFFGNSTK